MKKYLNKNSIPVAITGLFMLLVISAHGQFTETREFVKRFRIQPETKIEITNKYGRIELNTWNKDSVVIQFKMEINEKKPDKLVKTLDNLNFDITNSAPYLIVKTQIDQNRSQIESEFMRFKETILQTNGSIRIDMMVYLPDNHELRLENKFGDIVMADYQGETQILLSNGKLTCGELPQKSVMNLSFADATIDNLPNARIISNYSDIQLRNSGIIRLESKSSTIEILNSEDLSIDSRRDKFRIRIANQIDATGNFSQFRISDLKGKASMHLMFGGLDLEKIQASFNNIYLEAKSVDMNLYFSPESKFNYQITESKTNLRLGKEMKETDREILDQKENKIRHSGYFGKKMNEDQLIINATGGETNVLSY